MGGVAGAEGVQRRNDRKIWKMEDAGKCNDVMQIRRKKVFSEDSKLRVDSTALTSKKVAKWDRRANSQTKKYEKR